MMRSPHPSRLPGPPLWFSIMFAFVFLIVIAIIAGQMALMFKIANDPASAGRFIGEVVRGAKDALNE